MTVRTGRFGVVVRGVAVVVDALELVDSLVQLLGEHLQMCRRQHSRHAAKQHRACLNSSPHEATRFFFSGRGQNTQQWAVRSLPSAI